MAKPDDRTPEMEKLTDDISYALYGRKRTDSIKGDICVICGGPADDFRDPLSRTEYTISGMCQACQDRTFGGEDEEDDYPVEYYSSFEDPHNS